MQNLITAHCELTIKHDEKQQKNVGPVVVTFGAIFTAESVNELFCAICQDGIRFKAIYNPDNMYFLRHELAQAQLLICQLRQTKTATLLSV